MTALVKLLHHPDGVVECVLNRPDKMSAHDANDFRYKIGNVIVPGTDVSVIKVGDEIYYDKNNSYTMVINDKPYTIINERDVVVVSGRSSAL